LVGGTFKGAKPVRATVQVIDLPEQGLDRHRLKQKDVLGRNFDSKFGTGDEDIYAALRNQHSLMHAAAAE